MWLLEKKIFHHFLDLGYEGIAIPVRVKFEFEILEGKFVPDSLNFEPLYNQDALLNRYPNIDVDRLARDIDQTVRQEIRFYLTDNGYLEEETG